MITRQKFIRTAAATIVAVAVLGAAGCGQMRPSQKMEIFEARLTGTAEVPPTDSRATGMAEVMYNENTGKLTWKVTYSGLSGPATAGHIHGPAAAGANAGVAVPFSANLNAQPITGEAMITTAQYADLAAGLWYVNIHTAKFANGEIRGQLRKRM